RCKVPGTTSTRSSGRSSSGSRGTTKSVCTPRSTTCRRPSTRKLSGGARSKPRSPLETRSPDSTKLGAVHIAWESLCVSVSEDPCHEHPITAHARPVVGQGARGIGSDVHVGAAAQQPWHRPLSDPGVQVGRPEVGGLWISITDLTHGVVQCTSRCIRVEATMLVGVSAELSIEISCHMRGHLVVYLPEGADDVGKTRELKGRCEMDGLVDQLHGFHERCSAR